MTKKNSIGLILVLFFSCPVFALAQVDPNNWDELNLSSITIDGTKVYYEKCFEPNLPFFENEYKEFLGQRDNFDKFVSQKEQIFADINNFLGIKEINSVPMEVFSDILGTFSGIKVKTFYLVKKSTIKEFLIAGGQLPNITYDKDSDIVNTSANFGFTSTEGLTSELEFAVPVVSSDTFEKDTSIIFQAFQKIYKNAPFLPIHEIAEMTLIKRARPTDPYWRWFSDGMANMMAYEIGSKYAGKEDANDFLSAFDTKQYEDIKKEINLRYWMMGQYCMMSGVQSSDMPNDAGRKITSARYAYATFEARRLIEEHGIDCLRKILDAISSQDSRTGGDLLTTVSDVTGDDMFLRIVAYQDFMRREEAIAKYTKAAERAFANKDYEQLVFNLFRLHDLRYPTDIKEFFQDFRDTANYLFRIGMEKEADKVMKNFINNTLSSEGGNARAASLEAFIIYAYEIGKPEKALDYADELLKINPDHVASLMTKMLVFISDNKLPEAKEIAQKILSVSKNSEGPAAAIASKLLALDPNDPGPVKIDISIK